MPKPKRQKVSFIAQKKASKPVRVEFFTKTGQKVSFRGHKKITKPIKVEFYAKRKKKN